MVQHESFDILCNILNRRSPFAFCRGNIYRSLCSTFLYSVSVIERMRVIKPLIYRRFKLSRLGCIILN